MVLCVNCGQEVQRPAGTIAEACDECRTRWQASAIKHARATLEGFGYTVIPPGQQPQTP